MDMLRFRWVCLGLPGGQPRLPGGLEGSKMKVDFSFAPKNAGWAVGTLRNPHHSAPGKFDSTNGLDRFGVVACDRGPKGVILVVFRGPAGLPRGEPGLPEGPG